MFADNANTQQLSNVAVASPLVYHDTLFVIPCILFSIGRYDTALHQAFTEADLDLYCIECIRQYICIS